jgi:hypothetical protein
MKGLIFNFWIWFLTTTNMGYIRVAYHFMGALNLKSKEFVLIISLRP